MVAKDKKQAVLFSAEINEMQVGAEDSQQTEQLQQADAKERGDGEKPTAQAMKAILEQCDFRCALSGVKLTLDAFSIDHSTPLARGGKHVMSNLQGVHSVINTMKGQMTTTEFVGWCKLVADHMSER